MRYYVLLSVLLIQDAASNETMKESETPAASWPKGNFSFLSTRASGCPDSSDLVFEQGERIFDCQNNGTISNTTVGTHLNITVDSEQDIHLTFCTKNVEVNDTLLATGDWPSGKYCFYRAGGSCPGNFSEGWILWQDERDNNSNKDSGILPDGDYSLYAKTKMFFCCRIDGDPDTAIELPNNKPFVLLKYGDNCQKVDGTCYSEETVLWDNDKRDGNETHSGVIPQTGVTELGDVRLDFCYYADNNMTVNITGEIYCGVTAEWEPRFSKVGGWAVIIVLTSYAAVMMCVMYCCCSDVDWSKIKQTYNNNKVLIYREESHKDRKIPLIPTKYIQLPKFVAVIIMTLSLICIPISKIIWDVIDVAADSYYFMQLETGTLLSTQITRNTHVNKGILVFAALGAVKSTILGWMYLRIVQGSYEVEYHHADIVLATQAVVCMKVLLEDGPEMFLEYFYLDRYITANQPWWLIAKDVVTAVIYILPLKKIVMSGVKDYKAVRDSRVQGTALARYIYIPAVVARTLFSIAMVTRVLGMINQYSAGYIARDCLAVTDAGRLVQTPFAIGCLNPFDWVIVVLLPTVLFIIVVLPVYGLYKLAR